MFIPDALLSDEVPDTNGIGFAPDRPQPTKEAEFEESHRSALSQVPVKLSAVRPPPDGRSNWRPWSIWTPSPASRTRSTTTVSEARSSVHVGRAPDDLAPVRPVDLLPARGLLGAHDGPRGDADAHRSEPPAAPAPDAQAREFPRTPGRRQALPADPEDSLWAAASTASPRPRASRPGGPAAAGPAGGAVRHAATTPYGRAPWASPRRPRGADSGEPSWRPPPRPDAPDAPRSASSVPDSTPSLGGTGPGHRRRVGQTGAPGQPGPAAEEGPRTAHHEPGGGRGARRRRGNAAAMASLQRGWQRGREENAAGRRRPRRHEHKNQGDGR
ncbi:hypothetical protein ACRAWF_29130 [Streptomyces sp. L7]